MCLKRTKSPGLDFNPQQRLNKQEKRRMNSVRGRRERGERDKWRNKCQYEMRMFTNVNILNDTTNGGRTRQGETQEQGNTSLYKTHNIHSHLFTSFLYTHENTEQLSDTTKGINLRNKSKSPFPQAS